MKGRWQVQEVLLSLETWIVCVPFRGWMGKTKYLSVFERGMVVGQAHQLKCQELQRCCVYEAWSTTQRISSQLDTTVCWSQHGPASLWKAFDTLLSPYPNELRLFWGQKEGLPNVLYALCRLIHSGNQISNIFIKPFFTSADVSKCLYRNQPKTPNSMQCRCRSTVVRKTP